ncbi:MAG: SDR family oxidoreductase [Planctomycetota bacterium]
MKVLYIGGTGQISFDCVHRSVAMGHEVSVFNRGNSNDGLPGEAELITGDMNDDAAYRALAERGFDAVCQFRLFTPEQVERDIRFFDGHCGQYVFISSASAYQKPVLDPVITEDVPLVNPYWEYSRNKAECEAVLRGSGLPWTIVRPSHTYRTSFILPFGGDTMAKRIEDGKPVVVHGDGTSLWTMTRAEDFAVPFANLLGNERTMREDFHITTHMQAYPWRRILLAVGAALGVEPKIVCVPTDELILRQPEWEGPLWGDKAWSVLFDNSKVQAVAGEVPCTFTVEEGQAAAAEYYKARRAAGGLHVDAEVDQMLDQVLTSRC